MPRDPFAPIAPHLKSDKNITLNLSEKILSLTGDSGDVKDENGDIVFKIDAKHMSISERRSILDADGKSVGQVRRKKTPSFHPACYLGTEDDEKRCMVKLKGIMDLTHCDADIYVDDEVVGEALGNWRAKSFEVKVKDTVVATIHRPTNVAGKLFDADSYCIDIVEGTDIAFMTMVTIALDELYHDKPRN